jgi:hypothetical protein
LTPFWKKPEAPEREILEQVEPVEIPVINEAKRRLAKGDLSGAILHAYPVTTDDLSRAYGIPFLPGHTYEELLRKIRGHKELGHLPEYYRRFYQMYAPLRYGGKGAPEFHGSPEIVIDLLKAIYAERPMWELYIEPKNRPEPEEGGAMPEAADGAPMPPEADAP